MSERHVRVYSHMTERMMVCIAKAIELHILLDAHDKGRRQVQCARHTLAGSYCQAASSVQYEHR